MRPSATDIAVPPFRPGTPWIGQEPPAVERLTAAGPVLVHFVDAGHLSSVRTLPYLRAWHERYASDGLTVLGVNAPRFGFTAEPGPLAAALERLEVPFPVAVDSSYEAWHDYGCHGWPSLFLWGPGGALRWYHFGEGDYAATEDAIQELLREMDPLRELPPPLAPLRPSDAPGALVVPPTEEIFPGGSIEEPLEGAEDAPAIELRYEGAGAFATLDGAGALEIALDGDAARAIEVGAPGLYELAQHSHHETHRLSVRAGRGLRLWSLSFSAGVPA